MIILLLNGCVNSPQDKKTEDPNVNFISETASTVNINNSNEVFPDWKKDIPENIKDLQIIKVDLEGDGLPEIAVQYKNPNVVIEPNDVREIHYVNVYKEEANQWIKIKKDEATASGGTVDSKFCIFQAVNLGNDKKEELLVSKCDSKGNKNGYYIFGQTTGGHFEDFQIPKGYLHQDQLLKEGDQFPNLNKIEITKKGIEETYLIACTSRDWYAGRFGDQSGGFCRQITWFIPYANNIFSTPVIQKESNLITTQSYEIPSEDVTYDQTRIKFDRPIWLSPSVIYKTSHISLKDDLNTYTIYFGLNLDAIKGYLPDDLEILSNDSNLTKEDISRLLNLFCDAWIDGYQNLPEFKMQCTVSGNIATVKEDNHQFILLKLFEGSRDSVRVSLSHKNRELNYFDEDIINIITESFQITGSRETKNMETKVILWCDDEKSVDNELWISSEDFNGMNHAPTIRHVCRGNKELFRLEMVWDDSASVHLGTLKSNNSEASLSISSKNKDPEFKLLQNQEKNKVQLTIDEKIFTYDEANDKFIKNP